MKLKHFSLIFAFLGILFLYLLSLLSQPIVIDLHEISKFEGKEITTKGFVSDYSVNKYGSQIITIKENNSQVVVFIEGKIDVEYGDKIQATGQVQKYKNSWEIMVNDIRRVKIIEKWQNISFPLWQLAENPDRYLGLNVNVTGYVETLEDSFFYLVDLDEKHFLTVFFNPFDNVDLYAGKKVCIFGKFYFDEKNLKYVLDLCDDSHKIINLEEA